MPIEVLGLWGRVAVIIIGVSVIAVSAIIVACFVVPKCWLNKYFLGEGRLRRRSKAREKDKLFGFDPPLIYYKSTETPAPQPDIKVTQTQSSHGPLSQLRRLTPPFTQTSSENQSLLGSLSTKRDSTYSSMSENSGRTSPTNSCRSSAEGSLGSAGGSVAGSPEGGEAQGQISFGIQFVLTNEERGAGKLIITVMEARGLPGRQYMGGSCDPYVKVVVWRERRSIRKIKSPPLQIFRTRTIRHTSEPSFNQSFVMEVNRSELRDLVIKVVAMDSDKWVSPTTLGEVVQPLRDIKTIATNLERTSLNFYLAPAKLDLGEVLFGLSYLPTAQRLSVSVIKAAHLQYSNVVEDIAEFCPYVRVLLVNSNGRVLRKKRTTCRANTLKPIWNETLIFDLAQNQVEHVTFILAVCTRPQPTTTALTNEAVMQANSSDALFAMTPPHRSSSSRESAPTHNSFGQKKQDKYLGKVMLGCSISGEEERKHWLSVLTAPRKVSSQWHCLK